MSRRLVEQTQCVDLRQLFRVARAALGCKTLRPSDGVWRSGELVVSESAGVRSIWTASAYLEIDRTDGVLELRFRGVDGAQTTSFALNSDAMPLGGLRWWAICHGCQRRCAKLFFAGNTVACRLCLGLVHRSTTLRRDARAYLALRRVSEKLAPAEDYIWGQLPSRPSRMHGKTYDRLAARWCDLLTRDLLTVRRLIRYLEKR